MHSHKNLVIVEQITAKVLILVVMEDALAHHLMNMMFIHQSLNPCCNGRCTRTYGAGFEE